MSQLVLPYTALHFREPGNLPHVVFIYNYCIGVCVWGGMWVWIRACCSIHALAHMLHCVHRDQRTPWWVGFLSPSFHGWGELNSGHLVCALSAFTCWDISPLFPLLIYFVCLLVYELLIFTATGLLLFSFLFLFSIIGSLMHLQFSHNG